MTKIADCSVSAAPKAARHGGRYGWIDATDVPIAEERERYQDELRNGSRQVRRETVDLQRASGEWAGQDGRVASFGAGGWRFIEPKPGCMAWLEDRGVFAIRLSSSWLADAWPADAIRINGTDILGSIAPAITNPQGGTVADTEARTAVVQILAALRANGLIAV